jgi:hypothetical protein
MRASVAAALLAAGCSAHVVGLVEPAAAGPHLRTSEGASFALVVAGDSAPMSYLDGHTAEVWGRKALGRLVVADWKVLDGLHGLPTWVGPLVAQGVQIGVQDRNSGGFYLLDQAGAAALEAYVGEQVLVEGYVEGAHRVRVVYFRVLANESQGALQEGGSE